MLYRFKTFTLPASNSASQNTWDLATLSAEEFKSKYGVNDEQYKALTEGKGVGANG